MKKFLLIGFLILTSACQQATPTPGPTLPPTVTVPASPTPIPATSTLVPTPTLTPTSAPPPQYFTNEFDSSFDNWVILQAGNESVPNVSVQDGTLRLQIDSPYSWMYALYGAHDYADVYVETEVTNNAMSPASLGLICHYDEEHGWYEYNVTSDGTYNVLLGRWLSNGIATYLPISNGSSREIGQSGESIQIGMNCSENTLYISINGQVIRSVNISDYELTGGQVGLTASSYENIPIIAAFDRVTVSESDSP
jgi:hypothetical protein